MNKVYKINNTLRHDWASDEAKSLIDQPLLDLVYQAQTIHRSNFPKNEIQKFYTDIETNNDIDYAILCSLRSGIANKPQDFTLEFIMGKPVIFLHKVKDNKKSILLAYTICKLILKNMQCFDITKEENQIKIKQIVKGYLQNHKKILSSLNDHNKNMNEMMERQFSDFNNILGLINFAL